MGESGGDPELERLLIEEMRERDVDGVVYATRTAQTIRLPEGLHAMRAVLLNCEDPDARTAVRRARRRGRGPGGRRGPARRRHRRACGSWGRTRPPSATAGPATHGGDPRRAGRPRASTSPASVPCDWSVTDGVRRDQPAGWPAAAGAGGLICMNDRLAMGAYQALAEAGLRVPDDISVVSFDGSALAAWMRPVLTSVELPFHELGALAVRRPARPRRRRRGTVLLPMAVRAGGSVRSP